MAVDLDAIGTSGPESIIEWGHSDTILYALSVGAGRNPLEELEFTTENSKDVFLRALPTQAVVLAQGAKRPGYGDVELSSIVHAGQEVRWGQELPAAGSARLVTTVTDIEDKGSGALITSTTVARPVEEDAVYFESVSRIFARGYGGFGVSASKSANDWQLPDGRPDIEVPLVTREDQALLYRLNGDRNPLHSDPTFAAKAGFHRPILHGLCTFGATARVLLAEICGSDPSRMKELDGRFAKPVVPGDDLVVQIWGSETDKAVKFRTLRDDGMVVLDQGTLGLD